jgi:hypothetical protein
MLKLWTLAECSCSAPGTADKPACSVVEAGRRGAKGMQDRGSLGRSAHRLKALPRVRAFLRIAGPYGTVDPRRRSQPRRTHSWWYRAGRRSRDSGADRTQTGAQSSLHARRAHCRKRPPRVATNSSGLRPHVRRAGGPQPPPHRASRRQPSVSAVPLRKAGMALLSASAGTPHRFAGRG